MVVIILVVLGLVFGSFVNALVWRLHEQGVEQRAEGRGKKEHRGKSREQSKLTSSELSIVKGHSICPHCHHKLMPSDLVPVLSWLWLGGKCRYCHKPISAQYPLVELFTAALFVFSYFFWPGGVAGHQPLASCLPSSISSLCSHPTVLFGFWLVFLTGFIALAVYDIKWFLLPDKIVYSLIGLALVQSVLTIFVFNGGLHMAEQIALSFVIGGGLFYLLFQVSSGKWIGGGDVKLGMLLGLVLASPSLSLLMIFTASVLGTLVTLPLLVARKITKNTHIPFGPFLIVGTIIARLFGAAIISWYTSKIL